MPEFSCRSLFLIFLSSFLGFLPFEVQGADGEIRIGAIYSLTGWAAVGGVAEFNATQLAVEEINANGGIAGKKIRLIVEDNHSNPSDAVAGFSKLVDLDKVLFILGPNWAEFSEVVAPLAERKKIVMLSSSGYTKTLTNGRRFVFSTCPPFEAQLAPLVDYLKTKNYDKMALVVSPSSYLDGLSQSLLAEISGGNFGKNITAKVFELPAEGQDFRSIISRLRSDSYQGVVVFLLEGQLSSFFRQAKELGLKAELFSHDITGDAGVRQDPAVAEGLKFFHFITRANDEFLKKYEARFKVPAIFTVPLAYDNVFLAKKALELCQLKASGLEKCLESVSHDGVFGKIAFTKAHLLDWKEAASILYTVRNGKMLPLP